MHIVEIAFATLKDKCVRACVCVCFSNKNYFFIRSVWFISDCNFSPDLYCIIHERYLPLNLVARNRCQGDAWRICVKNGMFGRVYVGAKKSHTGFISCFRRSATSSTRADEFHLFSTFRFKITDA